MAHASTFQLTGKNLVAGGQQQQVYEALQQGPATYHEVAVRLENNPNFKTRQTAERIAAYYLCVMKKSGHVAELASEPEGKILVAGELITGAMAEIK